MAGKYDHIDFTPPAGVRKEADRGLAWRKEFNRGGTAVGVARARDLGNGTQISPSTAKRMKAYFDRHEVDKQGQGWSPGEDGFPSAGRIAWALWGGDPGWSWAKKLVRQMEAADNGERSHAMQIERRSLVIDEAETATDLLTVERRCECDENGDETERDWIVGYAARFGVRSLDLGDFVERIDPTAFGLVSERRGRRVPLETRALFNHDPNVVLGRYPTTLKLFVDDRGLRYEVLPPVSQQGVVESIRRGDIRGSSFAFTIAKGGEEWTVEEGRSTRIVKRIDRLLDVGPVTFPAYPDADVGVARRSYEQHVAGRQLATSRLIVARRHMADIRKFLQQHGRKIG
jgi:HK97 family phage prohead protease